MIKKILITALSMCLGVGIANANPTEKQKIVDLVKSSDDNAKFYSSDGKRFYQKEMSINDKGGLDVRVREKYLPAVTDGVIKTHKTSYFGISPQTLKYIGKIGKATNAVGIGLLMIDVLGEGVDWALDPANTTVSFLPKDTGNYDVLGFKGATAEEACQKWFAMMVKRDPDFADSVEADNDERCAVYGGKYKFNGATGAIVRKLTVERQVMSEAEFEAIVKDLAKAGNINAKQVILDAGKDEIADGKHDEAIERLADDISSDDTQDDPTTDTKPDDNTTPSPTDNPTDTTADKDKTDTQPQPETATATDNNGNFELPPFCSWASVVCDFIDWVRQEPPQDEPPQTVPKKGVGDIPELSDVDRYKERINFDGQCPTGQISFGINGTQYSYVMPYTHFCQLLEQLAPWLLAFTYLSTAYFIVSNL